MAAKPPKPPSKPPATSPVTKINSEEASPVAELDPSVGKCLKKQQSEDCACTNISIMQLFHQMKQQFPTVPDYIVNECVVENCHDREKCIKDLNNELTLHPNIAQAYPSQVFRANPNLCSPPYLQPIKPMRPSPIPNDKFINQNSYNNNNAINNCDRGGGDCEPNLIKFCDENFCTSIIDNHKKITSGKNFSDIQTRKSDTSKNTNSENQPKQFHSATQQLQQLQLLQLQQLQQQQLQHQPQLQQSQQLQKPQQSQQRQQPPQRPTTLNIKTKQNLIKHTLSDVPTLNQSPTKPLRRAPPPPTLSPKTTPNTPSTSTSPLSNAPSFETNIKSTTSIQSPSSFSDSGESEISVNISLSPKLNGPPQRLRSTIVLQPDPPYMNHFPPPANQKSYTSLNLTLREPGAQSPIEITAGPGLTYSSSSYDAKLGCQKNFQITVNDQGSMISSSRYRPQNNYLSSNQQQTSEGFNNAEQIVSPINPNSMKQNLHLPQQDVTMEAIHRQRNKKEQLIKAVERNKKKLDQVNEEIEVLTHPIVLGVSQRLDNEIQKLRCDCHELINQIENAKSHGVNVDNIDDPNSINNRQNPPFPRQKPPRPPPPKKPLHLINDSPNSITPNLQENSSPSFHHGLSISRTSCVDNNLSEANNSDGDDVDLKWTCSMCTFQNHHLLNKCECCDNIRITAGSIRIVPSKLNRINNCINPNPNPNQIPAEILSHFSDNLNANSTALNSNTNCAESETNLTHFAFST